MAIIRELVTKLGYEVDKSKLDQSQKKIKKFSLGAKLAIAGALTGLFALGKAAVTAAMDMESLLTSFEVMLGSTEAAKKMMDEMRKFSLVTPFETEDLARAGQTLLQFGIAEEKVLPTLRMLGDVAGKNTEKFNSLALVFGQIQSTGRLMGQDLLQLINQGFNPLQVISQQTGKSVAVLKDEMSKGLISAEMVTEAFQIATAEGGMFFENMKKQSQDLAGLFSTMRGAFKEVLVDVGKVLLPVIKEITNLLIELAQGSLKNIVGALVEILVPVIELITSILQPLIAGLVPVFQAMATALAPLIEMLGVILAPILEYLIPLFAMWGKVFEWVGKILQSLMPIVEILAGALTILFDIFEGIFAILIPIIDVLINFLTPIIRIIGIIIKVALIPLFIKLKLFGVLLKAIGWILGIVAKAVNFLLKPLVWFADLLEKIIDIVTALGKIFYYIIKDLIMGALERLWKWIEEEFKWLAYALEIAFTAAKNAIQGLIDMIDWLVEKVEVILKVAKYLSGDTAGARSLGQGTSTADTIKSGVAVGGGTNINMQANVNVKAKGNINDPRAMQNAMGQAARAAFTLELQKLVINAGL